MKRTRNDEDVWVCQTCGLGLGKHHCPTYENPAVNRYIERLESHRNLATELASMVSTLHDFCPVEVVQLAYKFLERTRQNAEPATTAPSQAEALSSGGAVSDPRQTEQVVSTARNDITG